MLLFPAAEAHCIRFFPDKSIVKRKLMASDKSDIKKEEMAQGSLTPLAHGQPSEPLQDYVFSVKQTDVFMKEISIQASSPEDAQHQLDQLLPDTDLAIEPNTLQSSTKNQSH